jgi:hypothetical protein
MDKRHFHLPIIAFVLLMLAGTQMRLAQAQQTPPQPTIEVLCTYVLKPGIPFAWLRFEPSSFAGFAVTLLPGETVQPNNPQTLAWDGVQWWVYVWPNASPARGYYWVELGSIEPRCQPPTPPVSGKATWRAGDRVRVRLNVPFVWFRGAPAPGNPPIHTVFPGTQLVIVRDTTATTDNFNQWWWEMRNPASGVSGWVEQNSVELVSGSTPPPTSWQPGDIVRVRSQVSFSWLRPVPDSHSDILFTVFPPQQLILQEGPQHDGVQNWWRVILPNNTVSGWVEEGSLAFVRR